jgi:hypothetical protein
VDEHGAEMLKRGMPRRKEVVANWHPAIVTPETEAGTPSPHDTETADPATVRPRLAEAAAESLDEISSSLLEAAIGAAKKQWVTFECDCGRKKRVEVPVPDVRARVAAIELLLREGLGRAPQAEEPATLRIPRTPVLREREGEHVRQRLAALGADQRRWLSEALSAIAG